MGSVVAKLCRSQPATTRRSAWVACVQIASRAFGKRPPEADNADAMRSKIEMPTAEMPVTTTPSDALAAKQAIYHYDLVTKIKPQALAEFARHQKGYAGAAVQFHSHRDTVEATEAICAADRDYLKAMMLPTGNTAERAKLLASAAESYRRAARLWELMALKYAVEDSVAMYFYPKGTTADNVDKLPSEQIHALTNAINGFFVSKPEADTHGDDRGKYERYYTRAILRLGLIRKAG